MYQDDTILMNVYQDNKDAIGFHQDNENGWVEQTDFATLWKLIFEKNLFTSLMRYLK